MGFYCPCEFIFNAFKLLFFIINVSRRQIISQQYKKVQKYKGTKIIHYTLYITHFNTMIHVLQNLVNNIWRKCRSEEMTEDWRIIWEERKTSSCLYAKLARDRKRWDQLQAHKISNYILRHDRKFDREATKRDLIL